MRVFKSDWVVQKVGPDGVNFSDFSAVIPMFVTEVECVMKSSGGFGAKQMAGSTFVAMYFVAVRGQQQQHEPLISKFQSCLETYASQDVQKLVVNKPADVDFDLGAYFGGEDKFQYSFVFTITLDGENSIDRVREAQKHFEEECFSQLNLPATWIACGERAVVLDQVSNIKVSI
ncbi:hypothetical protein N7520_003925 [Penicillium odoratum]|uniref:uncharacterized protein n=1 Tax=Penicillium odoratum TaxID=1167516 RepID=UPI002549A11F|nr:uncharacterized protein N7520_003925 [Penicillium odoratum]KAJ5769366.1 hypothetical protein N7520_003925 [Penicillium odoratum]